jgi:nicotinate-nucleotide pyrophosphorylase (carboxylating)
MNNDLGLDEFLRAALAEDVGAGDVTTLAVVDEGRKAAMEWVAKSPLVACGLALAARTFTLLDPAVTVIACREDGAKTQPGDIILRLDGPARPLLTGERVALNLAQRLCGIATLTRDYVNAVTGTSARICATRKTTPLLRRLEKYAVVTGGGAPHRFGLDDGVLIKDNHIDLCGSIREAVDRARRQAHHLLKIEVEVRDLKELDEALAARADVVLLDNMSVEAMAEAVSRARGRALLEASGNMTRERAVAAARLGVDFISVGALTHSAPAADISARISAPK